MTNASSHLTRPAAVLAAAAVVVVALLGIAARGSDQEAAAKSRLPRPLVLESVFDPKSMVQIDNAPKGESAGDVTAGAAALLRAGQPYGRLELLDYAVDGPYEGALRFATLLLPRGTLTIQAGGVNKPIPGAGRTGMSEEFAITGGTGRYSRASGTMTVRHGDDGKDRVVLRLGG